MYEMATKNNFRKNWEIFGKFCFSINLTNYAKFEEIFAKFSILKN